MVVAASIGEEGRPVIATFTEDVPNGQDLSDVTQAVSLRRWQANSLPYAHVR